MHRLISFQQIITEAWKNKNLRRKILYTIGILIIFRIGTDITIPGVTLPHGSVGSGSGNGFISSLGILGGGGIRNFSIFALGVSPYITSSIIIQLLATNVVPFLTNLAKTGEKGKRTQDMITRYLAIIFGVVQSIGITSLLLSQKVIQFKSGAETYIFIILIQMGGLFLALWMGDQINEKGMGNGVSMIILSGVVANIPFNFINIFKNNVKLDTLSNFSITFVEFIFLVFFYLLLILIAVYMSQSYRRVPIQNVGSGLTKDQNKDSYVVLSLNSSGVIPVIFATSLLSIPLTVTKYISNPQLTNVFNYLFNRQYPTGLITYFILIVLFSFFYSKITVNPEQFAEGLQKSGSYIPGIQPGVDTSKYISRTVNKLNFYGSFFLAILAIIPYILLIIFKLPASFGIGGTGLIIFVSVAINLFLQIKARLIQVEYQNLKKSTEEEFKLW